MVPYQGYRASYKEFWDQVGQIVRGLSARGVQKGDRVGICTRGYSVMLGYWNNPEATRDAIDAARWMHTGDLATMDEEGAINIVGRIKDMVIRGGENVYPREVEEFLYSHPAVSVQVIGVPDLKYGEELMAWVKLGPPRLLQGEDLELQAPPLLEVRGRLPDGRHGEGAEVQDARAGDRGARPRSGGGDPNRLTTAGTPILATV